MNSLFQEVAEVGEGDRKASAMYCTSLQVRGQSSFQLHQFFFFFLFFHILKLDSEGLT